MSHRVEAYNPYLPLYEYVPDGEPHVFGDRVYVYGSHDCFNGEDFCLNNYVCWSAPVSDLKDWKYEGVIYEKTQDPEGANRRMFAPDCVQGVDGRYYLYYALDFTGNMAVAVCDEPAGKYEYYGRVHYEDGTLLGAAENDVFHYDPGVIVDDDGRVYLYSGFCPVGQFRKRFVWIQQPIADGGMVIELAQDMLTIIKKPEVIVPNAEFSAGTSFKGHAFFEAPSIRKIGGLYYFVYSSENDHELCYATSSRPDGDFTYRGVINSNGDIGYQGRTEPVNYTGTNHGGILTIDDKAYIFYHRQTNGNPYSRQGCAEPITIEADGYIPQVCVTSCGLNGGPLSGEGEYPASIACCLMSAEGAAPYPAKTQIGPEHPFFTQTGEDRESDPDQYIHNMQNGAAAGYRYFQIKDQKKIRIKYRGTGTGKIAVSASYEANDTTTSYINVSAASEWSIAEGELSLPAGISELWLKYEGTEAIDIKSLELI